jgi:hypothetical protein
MMRCMFRPVREIPGTLPSHSSRGKTDNSHQSASSSLRYMHDPKKEQEDSEITAPNDFPQGGPIKRIGSKVGRTPDLGNFSATLSQLSYQASLHLTIFATRRKPTCFGSLYTYPASLFFRRSSARRSPFPLSRPNCPDVPSCSYHLLFSDILCRYLLLSTRSIILVTGMKR